jgi:PAS domain S-box-containing protein
VRQQTVYSNINNKKISNGKPVLAKKQQEVKHCNDNYHALFEQATDAIMVTDFNGNFIDVNTSLCAMFGYTKGDLLTLNVKALLDQESLKTQPLRFDLLEAGENVCNERKMIHKNGRVIYVEANAKKFIDNRILVIARDITERKKAEMVLQKSEANLQSIFDATDTIYVLIDNDFHIISYNKRAFGFAENELGHRIEISKNFLDYFPLERRPILLSYMTEVLTGKSINYEVSYPQADGLFNWYHIRMFPISKGDHNVYGLAMAVSDITEKIVMEQKLEEERIKKQQEITDAVITAEENERHALGLELHDNVNQLLATSRLFIGMAKKNEIKKNHPTLDEADKYVDMAITEIRNLTHSLISPFLENEELLDVLDQLIKTISETSTVNIKKEFSNVRENTIPDKLKLAIYRVVQEQLSNILKHAKAKTISLKLSRNNERTILNIKDDGIGFDTTKKTGGIGLINIRTRASLFNGKVNIISSPGNGCELIVNFN